METERLYLRLITIDDAEFLCQLMNTKKWHQMIGDRKVYTTEDAITYMQERMDPDLSTKGFVNHVMVHKDTGDLIGTCSLHNREGVEGLDIGYALLSEYEGYGYATEGAKAMVDLAFSKYHVEYVSAITNDDNVGSYKVLEKLGFKHAGYVRIQDSDDDIRLYILKKN